jgi:hypothetical protein
MTSEHLSRDISKLIAAIEREWREELGGPEATLTETVLRKVHRLLTMLKQDSPDRKLERLQTQIGPDWLESHPWATPYVLRIDAALTTMGHNSQN